MKKLFILFFILWASSHILIFSAGETGRSPKISLTLDPGFGRFPLYFISNQGQVNKTVKFYAKTSRYTLWLTNEGLVFDSFGRRPEIQSPLSPYSLHSTKPSKFLRDVSRLIFLRANRNPEIIPTSLTKHKVKYFKGTDPSKWYDNISTSKAVLYNNIYKNVDLKVYGNEKDIEYDWIVKPGGNTGDIRFEYRNVKDIFIDGEGNLRIETEFGLLTHKRPVGYQEISSGHGPGNKTRRPVKVEFKKVRKHTYGFNVEGYNRDYCLIIDPVISLEFATYLGGSNREECGMDIDAAGYIYLSGETPSSDFPVKNAYKNYKSGSLDLYLSKINPNDSTLIFSTYFGGNSSEYGEFIAVSPDGEAYITGDTFSTNLPAVNSYSGGKDICIAKFSTDGDFLGARYVGGSGEERVNCICLDSSKNIFVTGWTRSSNFPLKNPYQSTRHGSQDVFVCKLKSDLSVIEYSTYLGGSREDFSGIENTVDDSGHFYIAGWTYSTNFPVKNAWQSSYGGGEYDAFVAKFLPDGSDLVFATYLGGSHIERGHSVAIDNSGGIVFTGSTGSVDFPTKNPYQGANGGGMDGFIARFTGDGSELLYSTYLGGTKSELSMACPKVDGAGYIYLWGGTASTDFPVKNAYQDSLAGIYDAVLVVMTPDGQDLEFSSYYGGSGWDGSFECAVDGSGNWYLAGSTDSNDLPLKNPYQDSRKGDRESFVAKFVYSYSYNLTVQSTPYTGVPVTVTPDDNNGNGDGGTTFTRSYQPGTEVTLTAPENFRKLNFYKWIIDGTDHYKRTAQVTMNTNRTVKVVYGIPPEILLTPNQLDFAVYAPGPDAAPQTFKISNTGGRTLDWTITDNTTWLSCSPKNGTDDGEITVSVDASGLSEGTYRGIITVSDPNATNSPQTVQVKMTIYYSCSLTVKSIPDIGVPITVNPADTTGQSNGTTNFTRTYNLGTSVTLTAPGTFNNNSLVFHKWTIDTTDYSDPTVQLTMDRARTCTAVYLTAPEIVLNRTRLNFGAVGSITATGTQTFLIGSTGETPLNWTLSDDTFWLTCSPVKGANFGEVNVSVDSSALPTGTYTGIVTVSASNAANSPQSVQVTLTVFDPGDTSVLSLPFGSFDTPMEGAVVSGSIPVSGWALDNIEVMSVKVYGEQGSNLFYIGDAVFVEGARPDVETAYFNYPRCYRAGWGYMLLTNFLPNGGNGTVTLRIIAVDKEGTQISLGTRTIVCDNANAVKPFGAIDTPSQGGTASGNRYRNQGWALTPPPNKIPEDGHTIIVWVDGVNLGNPVYNIYRPDIAALFPGYANSNGAGAHFDFDTTVYENGTHIICWTALDSANNVDGIGSRYFTVKNSDTSMGAVRAGSRDTNTKDRLPVDLSMPVEVLKGYGKHREHHKMYPGEDGVLTVEIREMERVVIQLDSKAIAKGVNNYTGYLLVGNQLRTLPIGSTLDCQKGIFYWQPGPGFIGNYQFIFIANGEKGKKNKKSISVKILPNGYMRLK